MEHKCLQHAYLEHSPTLLISRLLPLYTPRPADVELLLHGLLVKRDPNVKQMSEGSSGVSHCEVGPFRHEALLSKARAACILHQDALQLFFIKRTANMKTV